MVPQSVPLAPLDCWPEFLPGPFAPVRPSACRNPGVAIGVTFGFTLFRFWILVGLVLHMVKWRQASSCASSAVFILTWSVLSCMHPSTLFGHGPCMPIGSALLVVSGTVAVVGGDAAFLVAPLK